MVSLPRWMRRCFASSDGHEIRDDRGIGMDPTVAKLLASDDAMVWAEEWCLIAREIEAANDGRQVIDEEWMVGWFANAMCVAVDHERRRSNN